MKWRLFKKKKKNRPSDVPAGRKKVGLLAIMRNEAMNLREWIDHYRWQGVDKIFLIDNDSTDGGPSLIADEVTAGFVELFSYPARHRQNEHYQTAFRAGNIRQKVEWLVMADLDEFWFSPNSNIPTALDSIPHTDLIYANWKMFGSCGYQHHPHSLRRCLTMRHPDLGEHLGTKWICRTDAIADPTNIGVHKVTGIDSCRVVSDNVRFNLNHYPIQSVEYFTKVKMTRGDVNSPNYEFVRTQEYFNSYDASATQADRLLASMLPPEP